MSKQDELLEFYNNLTMFSYDKPIGVTFDKSGKVLRFRQLSSTANIIRMNYYCKSLYKIKNSVLLPSDFKELMDKLRILIESGILNDDGVLVSPEKYGFSIWKTNLNHWIGPQLVTRIKLISSNWILFKWIANLRFGRIIR